MQVHLGPVICWRNKQSWVSGAPCILNYLKIVKIYLMSFEQKIIIHAETSRGKVHWANFFKKWRYSYLLKTWCQIRYYNININLQMHTSTTVTSQQEGLTLVPGSGLFLCVWVCMFSLCLRGFSRCSGILPLSKHMKIWVTGSSKLALGVNVSVDGCFCDSVMNWSLVRRVTCQLPRTAPGSSTKRVKEMNKWISSFFAYTGCMCWTWRSGLQFSFRYWANERGLISRGSKVISAAEVVIALMQLHISQQGSSIYLSDGSAGQTLECN